MFTVHAKVTSARVVKLIRSNEAKCENKGICLSCGATVDGCEPDARNYDTCTRKGCVRSVFGAEEIMLRGLYAGVPVMGKGETRTDADAVKIEVLKDDMGVNAAPAEPSDLDAEFDAILDEIG